MRCAWVPCGAPVPADVGRCARCRRVGYCGRPPQAAHWKAGHKTECAAAADTLVVFKTPAQRAAETFTTVAAALAAAAPAAAAVRMRLATLPKLPPWDTRADGAPPVKTKKIWLKAAESGHVMAQALLGKLYRVGTGVAQDYALAAEWYGEADDDCFERAPPWCRHLN